MHNVDNNLQIFNNINVLHAKALTLKTIFIKKNYFIFKMEKIVILYSKYLSVVVSAK